MFDKMIEPLKKLPEQFESLREEVDSALRHTAHVVRGEGQGRLWALETTALDWLDTALESTESLPEVFGKVTGPVEDFVHQRLDTVAACPVENYEALGRQQHVLQVDLATHAIGQQDIAQRFHTDRAQQFVEVAATAAAKIDQDGEKTDCS